MEELERGVEKIKKIIKKAEAKLLLILTYQVHLELNLFYQTELKPEFLVCHYQVPLSFP